MHAMKAIGAAIYHDHDLAEDATPLLRLIDTLAAGAADLRLFCVPLAPRREASTEFVREKLIARISGGALASALVETAPTTPAGDSLAITVTLQAPAQPAGYRYELGVALGETFVARRSLAAIVDEVLAFAGAVDARAGAIFPAETAAYAYSLAVGGVAGDLTEAQARRAKDVFYDVHELGDRARAPEWGNILGRHHARELAAARVQDVIVRELPRGGAYVQLTPDPTDASLDAKRATLAASWRA